MTSRVPLRPGKVCREVVLKDGRRAVLRAPDWRDLDDSLNFINELVVERAEIARSVKTSRSEEAEWLGDRLAEIEKGHVIALIAEMGGIVVGSSDICQRTPEYPEHSHVGVFGVAILKSARGVGLGQALTESLLQLAREAGFKVIILDVFATNAVARHLYEKAGFVEVGKIPKAINRDGKYIDLIRFAIEL